MWSSGTPEVPVQHCLLEAQMKDAGRIQQRCSHHFCVPRSVTRLQRAHARITARHCPEDTCPTTWNAELYRATGWLANPLEDAEEMLHAYSPKQLPLHGDVSMQQLDRLAVKKLQSNRDDKETPFFNSTPA